MKKKKKKKKKQDYMKKQNAMCMLPRTIAQLGMTGLRQDKTFLKFGNLKQKIQKKKKKCNTTQVRNKKKKGKKKKHTHTHTTSPHTQKIYSLFHKLKLGNQDEIWVMHDRPNLKI